MRRRVKTTGDEKYINEVNEENIQGEEEKQQEGKKDGEGEEVQRQFQEGE